VKRVSPGAAVVAALGVVMGVVELRVMAGVDVGVANVNPMVASASMSMV
jgi:hypothetical protein